VARTRWSDGTITVRDDPISCSTHGTATRREAEQPAVALPGLVRQQRDPVGVADPFTADAEALDVVGRDRGVPAKQAAVSDLAMTWHLHAVECLRRLGSAMEIPALTDVVGPVRVQHSVRAAVHVWRLERASLQLLQDLDVASHAVAVVGDTPGDPAHDSVHASIIAKGRATDQSGVRFESVIEVCVAW